MSAEVNVTLDPGAVRTLLSDPRGEVGVWLGVTGREVASRARQLAPRQTGRLAASIQASDVGRTGAELSVDVEATAPYSLFVHQGTRPHVITPSQASILRFPGRGGGVVFTPKVDHPGTKAQPFLMDALRATMRNYGG